MSIGELVVPVAALGGGSGGLVAAMQPVGSWVGSCLLGRYERAGGCIAPAAGQKHSHALGDDVVVLVGLGYLLIHQLIA